ncbi:C4b-binding protein beta chain-like, partial [Saccoglossus kowalevskii]
MTCSDDDISNGCHVPEREKHLYGGSLTVICDQGYYISTNYTNSTCQVDGSWEPDIPECSIVSCGNPGKPDNGYAKGTDYTYGSNVTYICDDGYTLNGTETITCQADGNWNADVPLCQ